MRTGACDSPGGGASGEGVPIAESAPAPSIAGVSTSGAASASADRGACLRVFGCAFSAASRLGALVAGFGVRTADVSSGVAGTLAASAGLVDAVSGGIDALAFTNPTGALAEATGAEIVEAGSGVDWRPNASRPK